MTTLKFDLNKLKRWITDSLYTIKKANNDAPILGGFSGSVIELLGRFLRIHPIKNHFECFSDFLKKYLPEYYNHKVILYKILRCEGAHSVLAQSGVTLTCDSKLESLHLKGHRDSKIGRVSLIIFSPKFVDDLLRTVENFFCDVAKEQILNDNCQKTLNEIYEEGQSIINKEINEKRLDIEAEGEITSG